MDSTAMIKKKVCILGSFAVGKTSLVRRFVHGIFTEKYLSTIGVKIDHKAVRIGRQTIDLILWDIAGGVDEGRCQPSYLRGLSAYLIVADGTRRETCHVVTDLMHYVGDQAGVKPNFLILNKADLIKEWQLSADDEAALGTGVDQIVRTSAKTGEAVDGIFTRMARTLVEEVDNADDR